MKLYDMTGEWADLMAQIDEAEGEVTPEQEEALDALAGDLSDKVERVLGYARERELYAAMLREEEQRLAAKRAAAEKRAAWLRGYVLRCLTQAGIGAMEAGVFDVRIQGGRTRVEVSDPEALPEGFQRVSVAPDKRALKAALEEGLEVPGARLVTGKPTLRVK